MAASLHRQGRPRRTAARLLGGALVCAVLAAGDDVATATPAQAGSVPAIRALHPLPGAMLAADSPSAYIAARITASVPIRRIALRLDGKPIEAAVLGPDDRRESLFAQPPHWTPGCHHVVVIAWDVRGRQARRTWWFWITSRSTPGHGAAVPHLIAGQPRYATRHWTTIWGNDAGTARRFIPVHKTG